ncbi:unnamed protein product [Sphagnum troendelagicum]|uniref:Uncharacterized protein n=1 Tax=Sphagnum troendelagicum TaxID=128251 RepID=A0ABP0T982_9BRYO
MSCVVCSWVFRLSPFQSSSSPQQQQQQRSHSLLLAAANKTKPSSSSSLLIYSLSSTVCTSQRLRLLLTSVERRAGSMCAFLPVASLLHAADKHPERSQRIEEESGRPLRYRKPLFHVQEKNPVLLWRVIDSSVHEFGLGFTSLLVDSWNFIVVVATDLLRSSQRRHVGHGVLSLLLALALTTKNAPPSSMETFENVPQTLSGADKAHRIQRPKSAKAESCTRKCVSTCIRGGAGAPGEGPLNVRRPLVVFKEGFRSRQYCLIECSEICNLIGDRDDGP